jgi:primosomal protein N'
VARHFADVQPLVTARALGRAYTYSVPDDVGKGAVVAVRFGGARRRGVVVSTADEAPAGIDPAEVEAVVERLPPALVDLALWVAEYYGSTAGRALALVAPHVRKRRVERPSPVARESLPGAVRPAPELTERQRAAVARIGEALDARGGHFLL